MSVRKSGRKSSKTTFTATHQKARYVGEHPHIANTEGVYYFNLAQDCYIYRPEADVKSDWYRVHKENLIDLQ